MNVVVTRVICKENVGIHKFLCHKKAFFENRSLCLQRKFSNGVLDPPEDACQFEKRPIKRNGVNFRYIKSAAANPREKAKLDLRIRIYEREAYVHQNGKLLISCVVSDAILRRHSSLFCTIVSTVF